MSGGKLKLKDGSRRERPPSIPDELLTDARESDVVVLVLGTTGVGKSTFINAAVMDSEATIVGHDLHPQTSHLQPVLAPDPGNPQRRIVFLDTLGFNHTYVEDSEIVKRITNWLKQSYNDNRKPTGIIYLHDISQARDVKQGTIASMIRPFCDKGSMKNVVVATTKWDTVQSNTGARQERGVTEFWNHTGSRMARFTGTPESACDIVNLATQRYDEDDVILLLSQTGAGKSTFINAAAGYEIAKVGHSMQSCTTEIQACYVPHPNDPTRRVVFIDTPGFNDAIKGDADTLRRILEWLRSPENEGLKLTGIIYLLEITDDRIELRKDAMSPTKLGSSGPIHNIVLATTKWSDIYERDWQRREQQRKEKLSEILNQGAPFVRFENSPGSAWRVVNILLQNGGADGASIRTKLHHILSDLVYEVVSHASAQLPDSAPETGFIARLLSILLGFVHK
ncbi:P-loop containing nucleoside triphosphate hydrolase protein [Hygrophoropsis aurantiaca]|uniref:P-loop containing nucleoside triphosphate hydrolase protein n=1 Tax=Hygrophoropsis aurantiaca TaxID=72124 RepID=A0ACB8A6G8_9AGAM|nr:P-loop containing nucleoside triphosphate hydrolase protein [Hygrophoropsis aurantiaca]